MPRAQWCTPRRMFTTATQAMGMGMVMGMVMGTVTEATTVDRAVAMVRWGITANCARKQARLTQKKPATEKLQAFLLLFWGG
jgi:hypothetical protein